MSNKSLSSNASKKNDNASKKGAPKPPASLAPVAKNKPKQIEVDEEMDEEDDDEDEEIEIDEKPVVDPTTGKVKKASQKVRMLKRVASMQKSLGHIQEKTGNTPALHELIKAALTAVSAAVDAVTALPEDWKRAAGARVTKSFSPGDIVRVSDARRAQYEDVLEKDEMDELRVVKMAPNNKVVCKSASGTSKLIFPSWHIVKAE